MLISLVSMVDVLMIMLVFFMVTSTYLNLDMVPMVDQADEPAPGGEAVAGGLTDAGTLLIRLGADGGIGVQGRTLTPDALEQLLARRLAETPGLSVAILPSGNADAQALMTVLDRAAAAGVGRLRVLRLEARP
jgi:biopolymer transport protein ExbD